MTLSVSIKLVSLSARVTSVKFTLGLFVTTRHIDRTRRPGSDKKQEKMLVWKIQINFYLVFIQTLGDVKVAPLEGSNYLHRVINVNG